jgi:hypothetical protein
VYYTEESTHVPITDLEARLQSSRFRYINEQLYTHTSAEAATMFADDTDAFNVYHRGYARQVRKWPKNPLDSVVAYLRK